MDPGHDQSIEGTYGENVEEARRVRRLFVLERSAQGGGVSDLSCIE